MNVQSALAAMIAASSTAAITTEGTKMKVFEKPVMDVQRLDAEEIMSTSVCFEAFECKSCYCSAVTCDPVYTCTGLSCPGLD